MKKDYASRTLDQALSNVEKYLVPLRTNDYKLMDEFNLINKDIIDVSEKMDPVILKNFIRYCDTLVREHGSIDAFMLEAQKAIDNAEKPVCFKNYLEDNCDKIRLSISGCEYEYACMTATNLNGVCDCKYKKSCFVLKQLFRAEMPDEPCQYYKLFEERSNSKCS